MISKISKLVFIETLLVLSIIAVTITILNNQINWSNLNTITFQKLILLKMLIVKIWPQLRQACPWYIWSSMDQYALGSVRNHIFVYLTVGFILVFLLIFA